MAVIEFSRDEKAAIVERIKLYFREELDQDIGGFDAQFLLDFFAEEIGPLFYNRGVEDARQVIGVQVENIDQALFDIEKPLAFVR